MTSPLEYAKTFARVWKLERPFYMVESIPPGLMEIVETLQRETGGQIYGGRMENLKTRGEGEFSQAVLQKFKEILPYTDFTKPCQEFLIKFVQGNLINGIAPEREIPLEWLGISIPERIAPFDHNDNLSGIEWRLLKQHDGALGQAILYGMEEVIQLNERWHEAYNAKYFNNNP